MKKLDEEAYRVELLLIRHGQSEADILDVHEGRADFSLTEIGEEQARKMAQFVKEHYKPEIILASPLKRAKKTAGILQEAIRCELIEEEDLMELHNGVLAGLPRKEAMIKYPLPKGGRPLHVPIPEGESELDFRLRVERIFHKIIHDYKQYGRIAVVSHGGFISNFFKAFLNLPINSEAIFYTGDTGMHLVEISERGRIIKFLNKQDHLV